MSTLPHITANPVSETPSTSDTSIGGRAGGNIAPKSSLNEDVRPSEDPENKNKASLASGKPGSAEAAAEKLYAQRMEDEYAKREGGA